MRVLPRSVWSGICGLASVAVLALIAGTVVSQPPETATAPEPAPPAGQTYVGVKRCSACHFKQFMSWKKSKHFSAFTDMPAKYQGEADCLKCHATGYGAAGGYAAGTDADVLQNLLGVTCEACHGPGSKHEEISKKYANKAKLDPPEEKEVRDSIWKVQPNNVCSRCHVVQSHQDHPKYDK